MMEGREGLVLVLCMEKRRIAVGVIIVMMISMDITVRKKGVIPKAAEVAGEVRGKDEKKARTRMRKCRSGGIRDERGYYEGMCVYL
jgi:hypothetical protein